MNLKEIRTELFWQLTEHVVEFNDLNAERTGRVLIQDCKAVYDEPPEELEELEEKVEQLPDPEVYGEIAYCIVDLELIEM